MMIYVRISGRNVQYQTYTKPFENEIKKRRQHMAKRKSALYQKNTPFHTFMEVTTKLSELLHYPFYFPHLAPGDYYLFPNFKNWLQGKRFTSNAEFKSETDEFFGALDNWYYMEDIQMLEGIQNKCIAFRENYVNE